MKHTTDDLKHTKKDQQQLVWFLLNQYLYAFSSL